MGYYYGIATYYGKWWSDGRREIASLCPWCAAEGRYQFSSYAMGDEKKSCEQCGLSFDLATQLREIIGPPNKPLVRTD